MAEQAKGPAAVYVAWSTFKNAIEQLAQGVPNRVDRSVFPGLSGGVQNQLLAAFKFLGLVSDDLKPTPVLTALAVPDETVRKKKLEAILRDRYSDLFELDLAKTTPAQLAEQMAKSYNVAGDTKDKALRFFLATLSYLDAPISPLLKGVRSSGNGTPIRRRRTQAVRQRPVMEVTPAGETQSGTSKTVTLRGGGTLTLSATLDLFSLPPEDRTFIFKMIDQLESYERAARDETSGEDS